VISYGFHDVNEDDIAAVSEVLRGNWLTTGPAVESFENDLSQLIGGVPIVAVSSGTAALHAAYVAAGIRPGDEVITPPITFIATQAAAIQVGAKIVFADVRFDTGNIDPVAVEAAISSRTVAIVAVDYAGHPADLDELRAIADRHGLLLIEDAAHSLGSTYKDMPVGSIADITTFSFFPTKNIATGEGGAIAAKDPQILNRARLFSRQGLVRNPAEQIAPNEGPWHQEVHEFGLNYRLPDILATLGSSQLKRIGEFKKRRQETKKTYDDALAGQPKVEQTPHEDSWADPMWHLYPLKVQPESRRHIFDFLRANEVGVQVNYMPAYWHPAFDASKFPRGLCPNAERFYESEMSLPIHTKLTTKEIDTVVDLCATALQ
jgi:dTDP-4-amino-4,6-dideoxygalactose transaminase